MLTHMWHDDEGINLLWRRYYKGAAPVEGDDAYQRWLRETVKTLFARRDSTHPIASDDERQWVERAVVDGVLAWSPGQYAVVLGTAWAEALQRERTPYE